MFDFLSPLFFSIIFPLIGTIFLGWISFVLWLRYVQNDFVSGIKWVLLEIVPPRDVLRSPKAMELFLSNAFYHLNTKGRVEKYWQGAVQLWFSLEIVSIEGQVHFYIRTPSRIKELIETQMYAQYPQSQVKVVEDYTLAVDDISLKSDWRLWGCEFKLAKSDAYPIKTYVDFGLDKDPKEEYKLDPISPVIELFSSIGKGEQMWSQIVITPSSKKYHTEGTHFGRHDWITESRASLEKLLKPYTIIHPKPGGGSSKEIHVPDFLKTVVTGLTTKTSKIGFDCGIRVCYVAKKEAFNENNKRAMRLMFHQYANPSANQFVRINSIQADARGLLNELFMTESKLLSWSKGMLGLYRGRFFFPHPLPFQRIFVLNIEELATIFHFPGQILQVPTLARVESKEASPPPNLPI